MRVTAEVRIASPQSKEIEDANIIEGHAGPLITGFMTNPRSHQTRFWLSSFLVAAVLYGLVNAAFSTCAFSSVPKLSKSFFYDLKVANTEGKPGCWWVAKCFVERPKAPDIVLFGTSQMGGMQAADANTLNRTLDFTADHDAATLAKSVSEQLGKPVEAFYCALPGAVPSDYYMMTKALFSDDRRPEAVVIGISPRDFIDNTLPSAGSTEPYHFFSKFVDPGRLNAVAHPDPFAQMDYWMSHGLPLRKLALAFQDSHPPEEQPEPEQTNLLNVIFNASGKIKPAQCIVAPNMPDLFVDNTLEYARRYRDKKPPSYKQQLVFFEELLSLLQSQNIPTAVVGMPLMEANRILLPAEFWTSYRDQMKTLSDKYAASWLDLSDDKEFSPSDFIDTVHLNARGGKKVSEKMAVLLVSNKQMAAALNKDQSHFASRTAPEL